MDIKLQGDIDGIEAADQIRTRLDIPVVYLTGYAEEDVLRRAKKTEPYGYLGKPISLSELRSTLDTALYKHAMDKRVRVSEERLQLAMETTGNGLWDWDIPTGETYYSQGYCLMLGLEPREFPEHFTGWLDLMHPEDREHAWNVNQDCIQGKMEAFEVEFRMRHKDGSWRWILGRGKSVARDAEGIAIRLVGTHADITDRKKAEEDLRRSEERFRSLIDQAADAIFVHDFNGRFLEVNQQACNALGYTRDELLSMSVSDVDPDAVHRGDRSKFWPNLPTTFEARNRRKDGEIFPVEIRLGPIDYGETKVVLAVVRDISDRKKAEDALRETEKRLDLALKGANLGIWDWNIETGKQVFNERWAEMLGYSLDEIDPETLSWEKLVHPDDFQTAWERMRKHLDGDEASYEMEQRLRTKSGEWKWVLSRAKITERDEDGRPSRVTGTHLDITDRKGMERSLRESENQLSKVIESISDGFFALDANLVVTYFNKAAEALLGRKREDVIDRQLFEAFPEAKGSIFEENYTKALREKTHLVFETYFGTKPYENWYEVRVYPFDDGISVYFQVTTERKKAEEELRKSNRALMALGNCSEALASIADESQLLNEICRVVVEVAGYRLAWVGYVESDDLRTVRPVAQSGYNEGYVDKLNITSADVEQGRGPVGTAIRTGMSTLVRNTCADPRFEPWKTDALKRGYASCIALPLIAQGEAFGAITIYAPEPEAFDDEETRFLERLAGNLSFGIQALREREKNKRAEAQIKASLMEKEVLLREIHHRVKNNLAVMQSMLRLQSRYAQSTEFSRMLEDAQNRIMSMALAHELLYQSENLTYVNVGQYVGKLVHHLVASLSEVGGRVKITNEIQNVNLGIDIAIPLGFILTELISNCLKHAFPEERRGEISVSLQTVGDKEFELKVHDDGAGMAADIDTEHPSAMGLDLVRIFVSQLSGTMEILREKGTDVRIRFRER